jgi:hypothetical protein
VDLRVNRKGERNTSRTLGMQYVPIPFEGVENSARELIYLG